MAKPDYDDELLSLQIALVRWQQRAMEAGDRTLVIFEGRDAAGKDGTIRRITQPLSVRATQVVALAKPTDRERTQWYFQRYVAHLPAGGEFVIFNRSWYNRAGVERVMGFASPDEIGAFLHQVSRFETLLVQSGLRLIKLWLDVSREEQAQRLAARRTDPLKALKTSPLDAVAQDKFDDYSRARDEMLERTHCPDAPWICVRSDDKRAARINVLRHLVRTFGGEADKPDKKVLFPFEPAALEDGRLAR